MHILNELVYFCDVVCARHFIIHLAAGVFFGFCIGHSNPKRAFWAATFVGFSKETIDFFKHTKESASFHYLTDPVFGLYDGLGDLLFWMLGGYLVYQLLRRSHGLVRKHESKKLKEIISNSANLNLHSPAKIQVVNDDEISTMSFSEGVDYTGLSS